MLQMFGKIPLLTGNSQEAAEPIPAHLHIDEGGFLWLITGYGSEDERWRGIELRDLFDFLAAEGKLPEGDYPGFLVNTMSEWEPSDAI
ncbi:MAG TPA: hypothetical protein V6D06_05200 [Trichocoleus sp.]